MLNVNLLVIGTEFSLPTTAKPSMMERTSQCNKAEDTKWGPQRRMRRSQIAKKV
jgi:hypothetical protein